MNRGIDLYGEQSEKAVVPFLRKEGVQHVGLNYSMAAENRLRRGGLPCAASMPARLPKNIEDARRDRYYAT